MNIKIKIVCDVHNEECELISVETRDRASSRDRELLESSETEYRIRCNSCDQKIKDLEDEIEEFEEEDEVTP